MSKIEFPGPGVPTSHTYANPNCTEARVPPRCTPTGSSAISTAWPLALRRPLRRRS
jgi:hypothetical protein